MNERDIFLAALEQPTAEQRSEYVRLACADDDKLLRRVEELLHMHEQTGEFLQVPLAERLAAGITALDDAEETAPEPAETCKGKDELRFLSPSQQPGSLGRLGHYEVQAVIGRGGMGIVLRAFDEKLHRVVAIKVMAASLASNAVARKRFLREARAAAAVCHDHIVTIHAVEGESDDLHYLVMHCVSGMSLQERIDRDGPLELHEILRIGMQTAAGLAAAHAQGLIHRDIKPANILLDNGVERVKITDFGLARAAADASISQNGIVVGTPQYMAPEQARGEALDARTDLFSLGSVLYAMCTGRAPFRAGSSMATLKRVCDNAPSPICEANADIPDWLIALIDKLQAKDPADRYQTAAEVAASLGQQLAGLQHSAVLPKVTPAQPIRARAPGRLWRRWSIAAGVLIVLAITFGMAEGTGATQITASVIRLLTPDGTLVVEMSDPGVKVTIDGDGGLVITGVGQHEVRLKPGVYKLLADKNGKPVPLAQELVTITRGSKTPVVKVSLEGAAAPTVADPKGEGGAFVVIRGKGIAKRKFDTLAQAVLNASSGDTIEIRGNGPFRTQPIRIDQALTIRAGEGFRPVVRFTPGAPGDDHLLIARASLVLEGLDIREASLERSQPALVGRSVIFSDAGSLRLANCRLVQEQPIHQALPVIMAESRIILRNCQFDTPHIAAFGNGDPVQFVMENCLGLGGSAAYLNYGHASNETTLEFRHNTLVMGLVATTGFSVAPDLPHNTEEKRVRFEVADNVFAIYSGMLMFQTREPFRANAKWQKAEDAEAVFSPLVGWGERRNLYSSGATSIYWERAEGENLVLAPGNWKDWQRRWNLADTGSSEGSIRFFGGDLLARAANAPKQPQQQIAPNHFRLREDSAGYRAGSDGKDLGADVDLVGPGPAYERWKETPQYQEWLKEIGPSE